MALWQLGRRGLAGRQGCGCFAKSRCSTIEEISIALNAADVGVCQRRASCQGSCLNGSNCSFCTAAKLNAALERSLEYTRWHFWPQIRCQVAGRIHA